MYPKCLGSRTDGTTAFCIGGFTPLPVVQIIFPNFRDYVEQIEMNIYARELGLSLLFDVLNFPNEKNHNYCSVAGSSGADDLGFGS
jgi:hypothetical protein